MDVLLHSKFSNQSIKLISQLEKTNVLDNINLICIDNKEIRQQILEDEKIKIKYLPCYIRVNEDTGNYDIFEGENAFQFFNNLQKKIDSRNDDMAYELDKQKKEKEDLERQLHLLKKQSNDKEEKTEKKVLFTPIDDLDLSEGISTYMHIDKDDVKEEKKVETKNNSILSKAMQMQKERS